MEKNRKKKEIRFANINFVGRCNARCFFCIGEEADKKTKGMFDLHFSHFPNLDAFLSDCKTHEIVKLYLTGLDSEPSIYPYLKEFVEYLKDQGFSVGIRTNGVKIIDYGMFDDEVSVSIHSFSETINKLIGLPTVDFAAFREKLECVNHRYALVVNRFNEDGIIDTLHELCKDENARYIQIRQLCTDELDEKYKEDLEAFGRIEAKIKSTCRKVSEFDGCESFEFDGKEVCVWKPMSNDTNSWNYFIDGKISKSYFVLESYNGK